MKNLNSLLLLFFIPIFGSAQSLNGVYTGVLSNDSTTIRKDQSFEMALTEYNGKVYGYAYSTFIVNDTLYYIVKRVKGKVEGDICEVVDDDVISHNFPQKPEKKVFVTYTLRRNASDSIWRLDGNWKTNLVQKRKYGYYSISGKVETKEEKDLSKSKLYEHLGDLDLQKTLAFSKPKETTPEKKPVTVKENKNDVAKNTVKKEDQKNVQPVETKPVDKKPDASVAKTETKLPDSKTTSVAVNLPDRQAGNQPNQVEKKDVGVASTNPVEKKPETNTVKTETKLPDNKTTSVAINLPDRQAGNQPNQVEKKDVGVASTNPVEKKPETNTVKTETKLPDNKTTTIAISNQTIPNEKKNVVAVNSTTVDKKPEVPVAKQENKLPDNKPVVTVNNQPDQNEKKNVTTTSTNSIEKPASPPNEKKDVASTNNKADGQYEFQEVKRKRKLKAASSLVDERVSIPSETIYFRSDSLVHRFV